MAASKRTTQEDINFMHHAVQLARRGAGFVQTNPMVGVVLVHNHNIIAQGYHQRFGGKHAENIALTQALKKYPARVLKASTLYLTLEPCSRVGKTPACLPLVLQSGIKKVIIGSKDPNPKERGRSIKQLQQAGIAVHVGVAQIECDYLIRTFKKWITTHKPYVLAKVGMSLDAKVTPPQHSRYITNQASLERVHELRQEFDAIMVGVNTILRDNPKLNTRLPRKQLLHHPLKIILDSRLRTPPRNAVVDANTLIVCLEGSDTQRQRNLERRGAEVMTIPAEHRNNKQLFEQIDVLELLRLLGQRSITSILLEGGSHMFTNFINDQAIDEWYIFMAPSLYGATHLPFTYALQQPVRLQSLQVEPCLSTAQEIRAGYEDNILIRGYAQYN